MNNRPPLRILHTESSLGWGGQEIRTLTEAAGMMQRGHQVTLLCPPEAQIFAAAQARKIAAVALPMGRKNLSGLLAMVQWLRKHPMDIILTHSSTDSWLTAVASRLLAASPPIVRLRHISAPVPRNRATRWLYTRGCRHIVTTGEALRQRLIDDNRFPAEKITSIPTGIDLKHFIPGENLSIRQQMGVPSTGLVIGIVATMRNWKGHHHLLEAFATLQQPDHRLLLVGDGPQRANLEKQRDALNLQSQVWMVGNQENVVPWLQACDLFVLPSYANEGVPQSLMQAMACGLPVIATPVGSIAEIVHPQKTGLLVPPKDPPALTQALKALTEDPALRQRLGRQALDFSQQHFSLDSMLDRMEQIMYRVMEKRI